MNVFKQITIQILIAVVILAMMVVSYFLLDKLLGKFKLKKILSKELPV